jgi:hypothetical protein
MILADPVQGRLLVRVEAILPGQAFPPNGVNDWALIQCEDTLSGEGGRCHTSDERPATVGKWA